jgi:hypothetical protein
VLLVHCEGDTFCYDEVLLTDDTGASSALT